MTLSVYGDTIAAPVDLRSFSYCELRRVAGDARDAGQTYLDELWELGLRVDVLVSYDFGLGLNLGD
jgi:hypothetical protein